MYQKSNLCRLIEIVYYKLKSTIYIQNLLWPDRIALGTNHPLSTQPFSLSDRIDRPYFLPHIMLCFVDPTKSPRTTALNTMGIPADWCAFDAWNWSLFRWFDSLLCALYISIFPTAHFHFPSWTRIECNPFSPSINDAIIVAKSRDPRHKTKITARSTIFCIVLKPSCWFGGAGVRVSSDSAIVVSRSACSSGSFVVSVSTSVEVELSMNDVGFVSPKVGVPWPVSCPTNAIRLSLGRHLALVSVSFSLSSQEASTSLGVGSGTSTRRGVSGWILSRTCLIRWTYQLRDANSCLSWYDRGLWRAVQSLDPDLHWM